MMKKGISHITWLLFLGVFTLVLMSCDGEESDEVDEMVAQNDNDTDSMDESDEEDDSDDDDSGNDDSEDDDSDEEGSSEEDSDEVEDSEAEAAPDFTLTSVDGGEVSLSDFADKPLVIFFFGDTCPLCIASAPSVESDINQHFEDEIAIIGIDTWDGSQASVENFRSTTGVTFDLLLKGSSVQGDYGTTFDRLFVIDGDGNIAYKGKTAAGGETDEVANIIEGLLE